MEFELSNIPDVNVYVLLSIWRISSGSSRLYVALAPSMIPECRGPLFPLFRTIIRQHQPKCLFHAPMLALRPSTFNSRALNHHTTASSCRPTISTGRENSHYSPNYQWNSRTTYGTSQHNRSLALGSCIHSSQLIIIASKIQRPYESAVIPFGLALEEP